MSSTSVQLPTPPVQPTLEALATPPTPPPNALSTAPFVILSRIFEFGARATLHERGLPFALLVSHVSSYWRSIVTSAPAVWCAIPVHPLRPGLTEHLLSQAGTSTQLYIYFHIASEWNLDKTLDLLFAHAPRVRELYVRVYRNASVSVFIWRLGRSLNLPNLSHLELSWLNDAEGHYLGHLPPILNVNPPAPLTSVVLRGAIFSLHSLTLFGLRSLTLAAPTRTVVPLSYVGFRDLLSTCPVLEYLKLDGLFPVLTQGVKYPQIQLPTLQSLEIVMERDTTPEVALKNDPSYLADFFSLLSFPAAQTFSFESSWQLAWDGFRTATPSVAETLTNIHSLRLSMGPLVAMHDGSVHPELFYAFPGLRSLTLSAQRNSNILPYLRLWAAVTEKNPGIDGGDSGSSRSVWPELRLLTIRVSRRLRSEERDVDDVLELLDLRRGCLGQPFDVWKCGLPETPHCSTPRKAIDKNDTGTDVKLVNVA